jgi:hypothetical protein
MNAKLFLLCFGSALTIYAADSPTQFESTMHDFISHDHSERFQNFITPRKGSSVIAIGRSDFVFSGPLAQGFRRLPHEENLSRGQKFLRLPVIRLFVPGPMERPPEGGPKYFAWKNDANPMAWKTAASRPEITKGAESSVNLDLLRISINF